jgi:aminopeptidase N
MMKTEAKPNPIYLKDYRQPDFWIPKVDLHFDLHEEFARVRSRLTLERNSSQAASTKAPLVLNGELLKLEKVSIDGRELKASEYTVTDTHLTIASVPDRFVLETVVTNEPHKNLACEGLYRSSGMFCTQCEAESFRRITYFIDRPDVMSSYTVTIEAEEAKYPLLLSNGNPVSKRSLGNGRHEAVWQDPHKKPSYLFALVAGDLGKISDTFVTRSGRQVKLEIYARKGLEDRCKHAMDSLKMSMKWDEDTYGLEYDLDIFMIVVAEDFNMGAMENKGLNIFNANYVLAKPETATDADYAGILSVVGHEYFHNWTGNRVTCRDWFQLSLKEGLTVFRDQRFTADMTSAAVNRIEEVIRLRTHQFAEDSGPMSHPVRPQSYISINNFYTLTVYEKGAEVIRMIETIVGREGFRKGMDLYFKRHDGQAVRTDDFVAAMEDANSIDLTQFKNWYDQAGTPQVKATATHDPKMRTFKITLEQSCPVAPGQPEKKPYHIPIAVGLIGKDGRDLPLQLEAGTAVSSGSGSAGLCAPSVADSNCAHTMVLHLRQPKETFTFTNIDERPVLSILRNFSAPVRLEYEYTDEDLAFLMANDTDEVARWEAAQVLTIRTVKEIVAAIQGGRALPSAERLVKAYGPLLTDSSLDPAFVSFMLLLPAEQYLAQFYTTVDVDAIHAAREHILRAIGREYQGVFKEIYARLVRQGTDAPWPKDEGLRSLKSRVLEFITLSDEPADLELAHRQLREAKNMTDELGALSALNRTASPVRRQALDEFYAKWKDESLVMNKWFTLQAVAPIVNALDEVKRLSELPIFDKNNPNKIYSLYVAFTKFNHVRFHDKGGKPYRMIADQVLEIDSRNPQVASRLMGAFSQWKCFDQDRQKLMKAELERILAKPGLSANVFEIASKTLNS